MKKEMKRNMIASIMVLGFLAAPVFAQNSNPANPAIAAADAAGHDGFRHARRRYAGRRNDGWKPG